MKSMEMFEKLELYEVEHEDCLEHSIRYYKYCEYSDDELEVAFYLNKKSVYYELGNDQARNLELLKAINNKLKELNWIK